MDEKTKIIYSEICRRHANQTRPPLQRELRDLIGAKSFAPVQSRLNWLAGKGLIVKDPYLCPAPAKPAGLITCNGETAAVLYETGETAPGGVPILQAVRVG